MSFMTKEDKLLVEAAIARAESTTSGEIGVHAEPFCAGEAMTRARKVFEKSGMTATRDRTGVLLYIAWRSKKFAILGDQGIHEKVGEDFWKGIAEKMAEEFHEGRFAGGIAGAVEEIGRRLAEHFPRKADDVNELSNEMSEG